MKIQNVFYNNDNQIRAFWRILIFISFLLLAVLPLILIENSYFQFFGASLILIFGLYLNSKYLDKRGFSEYGLIFKKKTFTYLLIGVLIGFFSVILMVLIGKATGLLSVSDFLSIPKPTLVFLFAFKMLLVSILEETFFRGYLFTNIFEGIKSKKTSYKQAVLIALVISSLLFGLAHFSNNNASVISITLLTINGMVWCIPFILTKNLGLSIGLHLSWNITQTQIGLTMSGNKALNSFYRIENTGPDLFTGGDYGPEAGILGLIGFAVMLLTTLAYLRITEKTLLNRVDGSAIK
tara:strand:- start:51 stop:932 length:882 start_codon:yes stop_codon:yes gene_type:complete